MGDIYRNSFITLAVTASKSGQEGCFATDLEKSIRKEYALEPGQTARASITVREKINHWTVPPSAATLENHPLLTRGWTFQEVILSPRVIHFCKQEMVWECKTTTSCECSGSYSPSNPIDQFSQLIGNETSIQRRLVSVLQTMRLMNRNRGPGDDRRDSSECWHDIVEQYSALKLTKETDRLPALSGLAQRASHVLGVYVAGLWHETIAPNLMWRVNKLDIIHGYPTTYISPSWSWVSVNGPVSYWSDLKLDKMLNELKDLGKMRGLGKEAINFHEDLSRLFEYAYPRPSADGVFSIILRTAGNSSGTSCCDRGHSAISGSHFYLFARVSWWLARIPSVPSHQAH